MRMLFGGEKGGTGKTNVATNVAACLANMGCDVILVDADPQGSSAKWKSRRDAFIDENPGIKLGVVHAVRQQQDLVKTLLDLSKRYEHVVIDAGGRDSAELRTALAVADVFYSPLQPSLADIETIAKVNELVGHAKAVLNPNMRAMLLLSRTPTSNFNSEAAEARFALEQMFDQLSVSPLSIGDRITYRKAFTDGLSVTDAVPGRKYGEAAADIQLLVEEITGQAFEAV